MSIENKLNYLSETKDKIKNAIISKGGVIDNDTTFRDYADIINDLPSGGSSEWTPDPDWWDIETILKNDTEDYPAKTIILYSNADDFTNITMNTYIVAVRTSDGSFYTSNATHTWDRSKDKVEDSSLEDTTSQCATRYMILYHNQTNVTYTSFNTYYKNSLYIVFKCNLRKASDSTVSSNTIVHSNYTLQSFKFLDDFNLDFGADIQSFCNQCHSLRKLPDNLDLSNGTEFNNFCNQCSSLTKLPDNLDLSNGTDFSGFCLNCRSLREVPDNLDFSNGIAFNSFFSGCYSLRKLPDTVDVSNGTTISDFCNNCTSLNKANIKLGKVSITSLSKSPISIPSLRYIAENAPTLTTTATLTIGSTNITRAGGSSGEIIQMLVNKGWKVN